MKGTTMQNKITSDVFASITTRHYGTTTPHVADDMNYGEKLQMVVHQTHLISIGLYENGSEQVWLLDLATMEPWYAGCGEDVRPDFYRQAGFTSFAAAMAAASDLVTLITEMEADFFEV